MIIVPYEHKYKEDFIRLNLAWLNKYFTAEERDIEMLYGVEDMIAGGAAVCFATDGDDVIATCMVVPRGNGEWEICKLAADEKYRGKGAGSAVLEACMEHAKRNGARKLTIVSNRILSAAMHLYEKFGFKEVPVIEKEYARVDVRFELPLS